jgi:aspartate kinase
VTNALLRLCDRPDSAALDAILSRHRDIALELGLDSTTLEGGAKEAAEMLRALAEPAGRSPAELADLVTSCGELWSSRLVAGALATAGVPSTWFDVREAMLTDATFGRAEPDTKALATRSARLVRPHLEAGRVVVTQGFIGATADGRPTTLGRGGSDYSASLLGAALEAARVEIWTDVDGVMSADPRIVSNARPLRVASHLEAAELAAFGAKVLHPATQAPLVAARIPCMVLNSFAPEQPGTTIISGARPQPEGGSPVRAISCKRGITVVNVRSPSSLGTAGFLRALFEVFERHAIVVDVIATSEVNVSVTVDDTRNLTLARADLDLLGEVSLFPGRAIVAVVGIGLRGTKGLSGRIFTAVQSVNVELISQGASEINVTFVVKEEDAVEAVRRLHAVLIEEAA